MNIYQQIVDLAVEIQQIPAPTFAEAERGGFVAGQFEALGLQDVETDAVGNVYGCLPGAGEAAPLVASAHLDTVFPACTDLAVTRTAGRVAGPGIGDNSVAVAGLIGLVWMLRQQGITLPGDLWLVANTGEEGLGDLIGMRAVVNRFADTPLAYLLLEGMALGQIYHRGLGVTRFRITARTAGGHSWVHYGRPSAIHELSKLVCRLMNIPLPSRPRTTMNVGTISGGISINTIAAEASLELDLRSEDHPALQHLVDQVRTMVGQAKHQGVCFDIEQIGSRPVGQIPADHRLVKLVQDVYLSLGVTTRLNIGSTDANIPLSKGLPAVCIGLTTGAGAHTLEEYIDTAPLHRGMNALVELVERVYENG